MKTKNKHAQALGRLGGAYSRKYMTKERAREIALKAVAAREAKRRLSTEKLGENKA